MAERERLTNKERRAQAREERKRKEAEKAAQRKRGQIKSGLITFAIVGIVSAVLIQAFVGGTPSLEDAIVVSADEVEDLRDAAGCEILTERSPLQDRGHIDANQAPNLNTVYTDTRPTHSGPHTPGTHPITASAGSQISEFATTHNLEHGTIIAWWNPDEVDGSTAGEIGDWADVLNENGFRRSQAGVGMSAPYEEPGIESGKAFAFRAWGTAMDCDEWDEDVANAFVLDHFGTHGIGPERVAAPFPNEALAYDDRTVEDTSEEEAPTGGDEPIEGELTEEELAELQEQEQGSTDDTSDTDDDS